MLAGMGVAVAGEQFRVQPLPECNARFLNTNGWTGADVASTVPLDGERTLWLFGDTWIGPVISNRHTHATMVNNTVAVQQGRDLATAQLDFFWRHQTNGQPAALFTPADGRGYFWPVSGLYVANRLHIIAAQIESTGGTGAFAFRGLGHWLLTVTNASAPPNEWRTVQQKIPFGLESATRHITFGAAILRHDGWVYIYGCDEDRGNGHFPRKHAIVARAPATTIEDFGKWQFWGDGAWRDKAEQATRLFDQAADEYSVNWIPVLRRFVAICTPNGLSAEIHLRQASSPCGPWSAPVPIYRCPEFAQHPGDFCYAAKGHPEISGTNDLVVTYATNTGDFWFGAAHADIYVPRCIRIRFNTKPN